MNFAEVAQHGVNLADHTFGHFRVYPTFACINPPGITATGYGTRKTHISHRLGITWALDTINNPERENACSPVVALNCADFFTRKTPKCCPTTYNISNLLILNNKKSALSTLLFMV
ncbi:MAG: hypothetical protein U1F46_09660 [Marinagarivorans sp.]